MDRIEALAGRHEQPVALGPAEAEVGADLRQPDLRDARAVGCEHVDPVISVTDPAGGRPHIPLLVARSEEHTSELQSLMRISYAVFCLKKKNTNTQTLHSDSTLYYIQ